MAEALECPVCLTLPEGEVHQCHEGHCYCADCWNRLEEPRRCPECRQPVPQANRSRAAERAIAALGWSCEHCGEATTRGAMAGHLRVCPQRPNFCMAAAAGCRWAGLAVEQVAHEAACPFAICRRMMAPLQAQNQQLQSECQELRALVAPLQAQNQELRGRMRAIEGEEEEGGRRQRQRVGPAPHGAPPSDDEVAVMELAEVVAVLRAHVAVARVAEKACWRLRGLCAPEGSEQAAAEAGAIEATVAALRAHPQEEGVQKQGCGALVNICCGDDAAGRARCQRATAAGAIEVVVAAMRACPQEVDVQEYGCGALGNMCFGDDAAAAARRQRAATAGAIEVVVAAMQAHPQVATVKEYGCCALGNMCTGTDAAAAARRQRAAGAGALEEVVAAMRAHPQEGEVQEGGCRALISICRGGSGVRARRRRATQAGARTVAVAAMQAHPDTVEVQNYGQELLDCLPAEV
eukprot:scaffold19261_cov55-Phaeocystis_antarctica.AAC.1